MDAILKSVFLSEDKLLLDMTIRVKLYSEYYMLSFMVTECIHKNSDTKTWTTLWSLDLLLRDVEFVFFLRFWFREILNYNYMLFINWSIENW